MSNIHEQCPLLEVLNLSNNRLISLDGVDKIFTLKELNLEQNYLSDEQIDQLMNLSNL